MFQSKFIIALCFVTFLQTLGCKPVDQATSSRGAKDGGSTTSPASKDYSDLDDPLIERQAVASVPVSGTNLIFSVGKDTDVNSIDAYVVGYVDSIPVTRINDTQFSLTGIPAGTQDIIVTGLSTGTESILDFDRGLRFPVESKDGLTIDLQTLDLPKTGAYSGLMEMEGVSGFATVQITFPGTRLPNRMPDSVGRYRFDNLPVGIHSLAWQQKDNPNPLTAKAKVTSAVVAQGSTRNLIRSLPNSPSNFQVQPQGNSFSLSWISGGGNPSGFLVYRSSQADGFQPIHGKTYRAGPMDAGVIVSVGSLNATRDLGVTEGSKYFYKVFAYNQDLVYSAPRLAQATAAKPLYAYQKYRLYIDSTSNDCQGQGTTQIQALNFFIDKNWQVNDFTSNTNTGKIGSYPVTIAVNNLYNNAYDAFYAFQDDNLSWSSTFKSYGQNAPFDVLAPKSPDGIYFDIDFGSQSISIEGLEMLGGEPPFFAECAPDSYRLLGSNDGINYTAIPGAAHQENTQTRIRYYFQKDVRPLSPLHFRLYGNEGQIQLSWESASGSEIGYLLARSRMPQPFVPSNGRSYGAGTLEGGYEIMIDGNITSLSDVNFDDINSPYYYTLVSYDSNRQYSPAIIGHAAPIHRETYRYYRFVVLSILGGGPAMSWMDSLTLQIDGKWIDQYTFDGMKGTIGGVAVQLSETSANGNNHASGMFGAGYWQTQKPSFSSDGMTDALLKTGEYVQMDFGQQPLAITGYRALGNTAMDANNRYSSTMYYQVPDLVHMERSRDGISWETVEGSLSTNSLSLEVEERW